MAWRKMWYEEYGNQYRELFALESGSGSGPVVYFMFRDAEPSAFSYQRDSQSFNNIFRSVNNIYVSNVRHS
jgi:hypothetical protein